MRLMTCILAVGAMLLVCLSCPEKSAKDLASGYAKGNFDQEESLRFLEGGDEYKRQVAAQGLAKYGDEKVIEPLVRHMHTDKYPTVRLTCLIELLGLGDKSLLPEFVKRLKDEDENIRRHAAETLGKMRSDDAYAALLPILQDPEPEVRKAVIESLAVYGQLDGKTDVFTELARFYGDEDAAVGRAAVKKVAEAGGHAARDLLIPALDSDNATIKLTAVENLGKLKSKKAVPKLISLLKSENPTLRAMTADALGSIQARDAIDPLRSLLRDNDMDVRRAAVGALGKIGGPECEDEFINMLDDGDVDVRRLALEALEKKKVRSGAFKAKLRTMSRHEVNYQLREKAKELLEKLK